jgi:hypothetical protein
MRRHGHRRSRESIRAWLPVGNIAGWLLCLLLLVTPVFAQTEPSVFCNSPQVSVTAGSTGTAYVNCGIYSPESGRNYRLLNSSNNLLSPAALLLQSGSNQLNAIRQSSVISPDNTVSSIAGTAAGFTATLLNVSAQKNLQFQYNIATTAQTASGLYSSFATASYFQYRICSSASCSQQVYTGTAPFMVSLNVQGSPLTVSCNSPAVNATAGGGTFTLNVTCTISGGGSRQFSPASQNLFSPSAITLTQGGKTISATLQPLVTSPDSSVTGISGTASGGFMGTANALPAKVMVQYQGTTTGTTQAGAYTSSPVTFTWSTI